MAQSESSVENRLTPIVVAFICLVCPIALSAQQAARSDPAALALIKGALANLTGGTEVRDVTLEGTATYAAGSDVETGTATLQALGNKQSRVMLSLSGGQRQQLRDGPAGAWSGPDAQQHSMSPSNCWTDAAWFSPPLMLAAAVSDPEIIFLDAGPATWNGAAAYHVRFYRSRLGLDSLSTAAVARLSTEDLYLDPATGAPLAVDLDLHPDDHAWASISTEIRYSQYRKVDGVSIAFSVQKFLNRSLLLDLNVTNATINSGLSPALFSSTTGGAQ